MADLRVEYALLDESSDTLRDLRDDFGQATQHRDAVSGIWGADEVRSAMDEFVDNWTRHRRLLLEAIDGLGSKVEGVLEGFRQTDGELAEVHNRAAGNGCPR